MPATPKKLLQSPQTPTRASRRLRHEDPELNVSNPFNSPTKSARKRALNFDGEEGDLNKSTSSKGRRSSVKGTPKGIKSGPIFSSTPKSPKESPQKSPVKQGPQKSPAKKESPLKKESPQKPKPSQIPVPAKRGKNQKTNTSLDSKKSPPKALNKSKEEDKKLNVSNASSTRSKSDKSRDTSIASQKKSPKLNVSNTSQKGKKQQENLDKSKDTSIASQKKSPKLNVSKDEDKKLNVSNTSQKGKKQQENLDKSKDVSLNSSQQERPRFSVMLKKLKGTPPSPQKSPQKPSKNVSTVDEDKFFSRTEMENFLDQQENQNDLTASFFAEFEDDVGDANYHYDDFFGNTNKSANKTVNKSANKSGVQQQQQKDDESSDPEEDEDMAEFAKLKPLDADGTGTDSEEEEEPKKPFKIGPEGIEFDLPDSDDEEENGQNEDQNEEIEDHKHLNDDVDGVEGMEDEEIEEIDLEDEESELGQEEKLKSFGQGLKSFGQEELEEEEEDEEDELDDESNGGYDEEMDWKNSSTLIDFGEEPEDEEEGSDFEDEEDIDGEEQINGNGLLLDEAEDGGEDDEEELEDEEDNGEDIGFEEGGPGPKKAKVTFDLEDEDEEMEDENVKHPFEEREESSDEEVPLTNFSKQQKNTKETIAEFEQQNLEPRSWELSGEVAAHQREKDTLLHDYIEVDYRATQAPVINEDTNARIESIVKKRVKDKNFDDVVRVKRVDESLQTYRARTNIDEIERKTLMEMYENEYRKKSEANGNSKENLNQIADDAKEEEEKLDQESEDVKQSMDGIFYKLDALCHSQYRPSEVNGEPEVIVNKLAVNLEEIGQKAVAAPDEELLAPEEVVKHAKFVPKSKEERSKTDKLRERRKKKKKQKIIIRKLIRVKKVNKKESNGDENGGKSSMNGGKFRGSKVFDQLQSVTQQEKHEKMTKTKKRKLDSGPKIKSTNVKL